LRLLKHLPEGFTVVSADESIFVHDAIVAKVWALEGVRPVCLVTGSHQRTCIFGALSLDERQIFRQYDVFDENTFLDFLKKVHRKFGRCYLFLDKANQHYKSRKVREYMRKNRSTLRVRWFPTASPEFNVIEECWRQAEKDLLASRYYPSFPYLKKTIATYFRTKRFKLDMRRFLLSSRG